MQVTERRKIGLFIVVSTTITPANIAVARWFATDENLFNYYSKTIRTLGLVLLSRPKNIRTLGLVFHCLFRLLTLFSMGLFGAAYRWGWGRALPLENLSHVSYIDETWHSYTLPKENPKNI